MTFSVTDAIAVAAIAFFAALAQGATGFGFAIIALPLLLGVMGSLDAVGLTIILNLLVSLVLVPGLWRQAPKPPLIRLSVGSMIGFPIGLVVFLNASLDWVRLAVGLIILLFAGWLSLSHRRMNSDRGPASPRGWAEIPVGMISGAMATALAMPGPSVMLYLSASGMAKAPLRATTLCLFTLSYAAALALQAAAGAIDAGIWKIVVLAAGPTAVGAVAGHRLSGRLGEGLFRTIVLAILLVTGAYTTVTAIGHWL
ncbi:MAG: sulfite exporter TauE/SafE family protein [Rhodospirillaceae bacterium]|jgi:uncharacterized protein|nr:sulfite exporter TauE/SafE family protein [Rhodospirillaceae bacterium]MBT6429317.1 sulfite exporter TauE/SafE family protein [Rhodospirillaceae bacterium]MBT7757105.1 sulfite exporter TauE/SafE family protein [Rhodospirillaceae bacterium]